MRSGDPEINIFNLFDATWLSKACGGQERARKRAKGFENSIFK